MPDDAGIGQLWSLNLGIRKPMNDLGKAIMRDESPLSAGQRETIAAFVSALSSSTPTKRAVSKSLSEEITPDCIVF